MRRFIQIIGLIPVVMAAMLLRIQANSYTPENSSFAFYILIMILVGTAYLMALGNVRDDRVDIFLESIVEYKIAYILEAVLFGVVILTFLPFIYDLLYTGTVHISALFWFVISAIVFLWFFINLIMGHWNKPEDLFAIAAIPICMAYCFIIVPNGVPDEPSHYGKAYLVSTGVLTNEFQVAIPTAYTGFGNTSFYNYEIFIRNFFAPCDYQDLMVTSTLVQSNFIYYIIPALGIGLARIMNLSLMAGYVLGRMFNAFFYIFVGYWTIRKIPFGKYIFLLYMLSPVCVQQASSMSLDVILHSFSFFTIAYILDIALNKEEIEYLDICILGTLMVIACLQKPNYIILWGFVFVCSRQLKSMTLSKWLLVALFVVLLPLAYRGNTLLLGIRPDDWTPMREGVDASAQMRYLLEDVSRIPTLWADSLQMNSQFYLESFAGVKMSWFNISLPELLAYGYLALNFTAIPFGEGETRLHIGAKIWSIILVLLLGISAMLAMYLYWTPVGGAIIEGVQGRYFIPFAVLILFVLVPKHKINWSYTGQTYTVILSVLQIAMMVCLFAQYV